MGMAYPSPKLVKQIRSMDQNRVLKYLTSSYSSLLGMWLFIHAEIKVNPC